MWKKFSLFMIIGRVAPLTAGMYFTLVVAGSKLAVTRAEEAVLAATAIFLPGSIGAWWIFRRLQTHYTKREARAVAIGFAVFMPMSLAIANPLAQIPGGYAAILGPSFGLIGAVAGIVVMTTLISFLLCSLALWVTRRDEQANDSCRN